jgi:hypothetical protein
MTEGAKRSLHRRLERSRIGRFKPIADFDWNWPKKIERDVLESEARSRKVTLDELLRTEVEGKARPVTHEEARAVLENGPERFSPDQSGETLLADIMDRMLENRTAQPRKELSREMRSRHTVKLLLEQPRISVRANDGPARGPEKASVTMVVFTDFQCPYSARVSPTLQSLREKYGDHIRLVFRHSPLPFHKDAAVPPWPPRVRMSKVASGECTTRCSRTRARYQRPTSVATCELWAWIRIASVTVLPQAD